MAEAALRAIFRNECDLRRLMLLQNIITKADISALGIRSWGARQSQQPSVNFKHSYYKQQDINGDHRRAGESVEAVAKVTTKKAAEEAYHVEMSEVADVESTKALQGVELLEDLGVGVLADASPITKRLVLKQERAVSQGAQEALEGDSYQSGIGHNEHPDIEKLPDPVVPGCFKPVTLPSAEEPTLVMFDLETTDLIRGRQMPHIVQIAAVELKSEATFNTYV
uniref:Uncharacterized protein n=1 Tax=Magallana gigas TaxID=29159 RepID=K1QE96_MAGGI